MKKILMTILCAMFFTFGIAFSTNALEIDASNYIIYENDTSNGTYEYYTGTKTGDNLSWWYGFQTGVGNSNSNHYKHYSPAIGDITGYSEALYKSDHDEGNTTGVDSGDFPSFYETTFEPEDDPNDAEIAFTGASYIDEGTHLLVKDGNQDPSWYLFDIDGHWNGTEKVYLNNFWNAGNGGISHVSLYGSNSVAHTPEPGTMLLFGTGLIGLAWVGRRQLQRRKDA